METLFNVLTSTILVASLVVVLTVVACGLLIVIATVRNMTDVVIKKIDDKFREADER